MNKTIKGELATGVVFDGKRQKNFEIKVATIGDIVDLYDTPAAERAGKNFYFQQVALTALRLVKLGDVPKAQITPELLFDLTETDMNTLAAASRGLDERGELFRSEERELEGNTNATEARI
jgi:hypothetical protein